MGDLAQVGRVAGVAAVRENNTDSRQKQEPAKNIGGSDLQPGASVRQDQDEECTIHQHRGYAEKIADPEQHYRKKPVDSC